MEAILTGTLAPLETRIITLDKTIIIRSLGFSEDNKYLLGGGRME